MPSKSKQQFEVDYSEKELERRRDEVIRRMANTPPQPKVIPHPKKKKITVEGRAARNARAPREA